LGEDGPRLTLARGALVRSDKGGPLPTQLRVALTGVGQGQPSPNADFPLPASPWPTEGREKKKKKKKEKEKNYKEKDENAIGGVNISQFAKFRIFHVTKKKIGINLSLWTKFEVFDGLFPKNYKHP